jgi:hypothetical protein
VRRREVGVTCGAEAARWREEAEAGQREGAEAARWATARSSDGKFPLGGAKGLILFLTRRCGRWLFHTRHDSGA